ncbi:MAG: methyltransferase domain-containing protein [Bacteroidota bacterium]
MKNDVIRSWEKNAKEWINVIENNQIESRKHTNNAIVQELSRLPASKLLDVGCGEGWLTRSITAMDKEAIGIDAIADLLENARKKGPENYYQISYEEVIAGTSIPEAPFDTAVFNFCLYQKDGLTELLSNIKQMISADGHVVIQTLHPFFLLRQDLTYKSQWIQDSWKGLPGNFIDGHPWYARTFNDWMNVFNSCKMTILNMKEVVNTNGYPISVIFILNCV